MDCKPPLNHGAVTLWRAKSADFNAMGPLEGFEKMTKGAPHPRIMERASRNPNSWIGKFREQRDIAIIAVENGLSLLRWFETLPGFTMAHEIAREYEKILYELRIIDPENPPHRDVYALMTSRLRLLAGCLNEFVQSAGKLARTLEFKGPPDRDLK